MEFLPADELAEAATPRPSSETEEEARSVMSRSEKAASGNYETNPIIAMQHPVHWMERGELQPPGFRPHREPAGLAGKAAAAGSG